MKAWSQIPIALLATVAVSDGYQYESRRQDGLVDPSTDKDCTFFDTAYDKSYTCSYFESNWGLSHATFVAWNPSVKSDCSGLKIGNSYCVEVTRPTTTITTTVRTSASPKPSPTQAGLTESCTTFYKAVRGDTCEKVVAKYGTFTQPQFIEWNPAVGSDCSGIWADTYYCVGVPGTPTSPPTTTPASPSGSGKPSPIASGTVSDCRDYYKAARGDTCDKIVATYGTFKNSDFVTWNPSVGSDCSGLQAEVYYCVGVASTPTTRPSTTTTTTKASNGITTPTPTQAGMVDNCDEFYFVQSGDSCQTIADKSGITLNQFTSWQNVGGSSCPGLYANVYVCISIVGHTRTSTTRTTTTTTRNNGISTPTPTQKGMVDNCDSFYYVKSGDSCQAIADKNGITLGQFTSWQDVGGTFCSGLYANVYVCISIVGHSPTFTSTTKSATTTTCATAHPTPTQPGGVCRCKRWHKVASGNTCDSIQKQYGITAAQFNSWNPEVGSDCSKLWRDYYVCVSA